jgi:hypothetical protein
MDRDLVKKARDGRLNALKRISSRHSPAMNVLPLLPGNAGQRSWMLNDPRKVSREPAAFEPPVPLASGLGSNKRQPV